MPTALPLERLRINGVAVDRDAANVHVTRRLLHNLDGPDEVHFTEFGVYAPSYKLDSKVELLIAEDLDGDGSIGEGDYVVRFAGVIKQAPMTDGKMPRIDYIAPGLKYLADDVRVTHPQSGKTEVRFNLSPADSDYEDDLAILQLGEIFRRVLTYDDHATDLWYKGITAYTVDPPYVDPTKPELGRKYNTAAGSGAVLRSATLADLAKLTVVPDDVTMSGSKLWAEIENALRDSAPWAGPEILPDGTIRFHDTRDPQWLEVQIGNDPVAPPSLTLDGGECYSAVEVIGDARVEGETFQTSDGTLVADWSAADEAAWKWSDFAVKSNATSTGTIVSIGPTSVVIRPTGGATSWVANKWASDRATVELILPIGPSNPSQISENRRVKANTACVSGGTCTVSLEYPLAQTGYTNFKLTGQGDNPRRFVHRRYKLADGAKASRMVDGFPYPVFWEFRTGGQYVTTPVGKNFRLPPGNTGDPFQADLFFTLFTDTDGVRKVLASEPTVKTWTAQADMDTGGSSVKKPTNILVFLPIAHDLLVARYPAAGYEGPGYDDHGIRRVRYVPQEDWKFEGDRSRQADYAKSIHDVVKEPSISGDLTYFWLWHPGVSGANLAVKLTSVYGPTPWQGSKLTIRGVEIIGQESGPHTLVTNLRVSNQRRPWTGERYYQAMNFVEGGPLANAPDLDLRR